METHGHHSGVISPDVNRHRVCIQINRSDESSEASPSQFMYSKTAAEFLCVGTAEASTARHTRERFGIHMLLNVPAVHILKESTETIS